MNIIFTLCSNNYLAQAKVLTDSVHFYNPNDKIIIGLVDELDPEINYDFFAPAEIITVKKIGLEKLKELCQKYDIVELNTSVKASYLKYLIDKYKEAVNIIYFDPDIRVFHSLEFIYKKLLLVDILLTPHILSPTPDDDMKPQENVFLNYGIYNLGFIAINTKGEEVRRFIKWWEHRILNYGFSKVAEGFFVDQLWINLVPLFFNSVSVLKNPGCNMAPWNLHERFITQKDEIYFVNNDTELIFYHFSSYDYKFPEVLCKEFYTRYTLQSRPDLQSLYRDYNSQVINNKAIYFSNFLCALLPVREKVDYSPSLKEKIFFWIRQFKPPIFNRLFK